ncbi:MAG: FAD-binding oxidoreductase [Paracoccaceae bacterium]
MPNPADPAFLDSLTAILPPDTLRPPEPRYLEEPRGKWHGSAGAVALPRTTEEVARIVAACAAAGVGIVPYGGGTGLVGGQIAPAGHPLVISLERMHALRGAWADENVLVVEAGMILSDVQAAAANIDRLFPLSLAAEGTARIGGNLATNAGGLNVLRYGNARDLCLGIEAVLPDGSVFHGLKRLRKDNTGYDLRNLLIGAEGSLGLITAAALRLFPRPTSESTALLAVPSPRAALDLLARAGARFGQTVTAFELIHRQGFDFIAETMPDVRIPLSPLPEWMVLTEIGFPEAAGPAEEALETFLADAMELELVTDGIVAASQAQRKELWQLRETIPEANRNIGAIASHDVSLPLSEIPGFLDRARPALLALADIRINAFGHLGDGNLHYNLFPAPGRNRKDYDAAPLTRLVHDLVHSLGGSVSAEHGIGRLKADDLTRYGDPAKLAAMRAIKQALDPRGIMNPGVIIA